MAKNDRTILVIDDEEPICLLLKWILKKDFNVVTYNSGVEALMWLKQGNTPQMIITDIKMPNFNGIDFVKGLKKSGMYRDIPIILLSGSIEAGKQEDGLKAGAFAYVQKPFDPDFLKETIDRGLSANVKLD
jgi:CheY-like chemotaxis protein